MKYPTKIFLSVLCSAKAFFASVYASPHVRNNSQMNFDETLRHTTDEITESHHCHFWSGKTVREFFFQEQLENQFLRCSPIMYREVVIIFVFWKLVP